MKFKELKRLAKLSIKTHKKQSKSIVRGLVIGFIVILPLLIAYFGVTSSLNNKMNKNSFMLHYSVELQDKNIDIPDKVDKNNQIVSGYKHFDNLYKDNFAEDKIVFENAEVQDYEISINNSKFTKKSNSFLYSVTDVEKSTSFFPKNLKTYKGGIYLDKFNQGFTGNGKKQVILSEKFLNENNLKPSDVYLKNISIKSKFKYCSDQHLKKIAEGKSFNSTMDTIIDAYLCKNYQVVAILKYDLYKDDTNKYLNNHMFFSSINAYKDGKPVLKPKYVNIDDFSVIGFDSSKNLETLNDEFMFFIGKGQGKISTFMPTVIQFTANNYNDISKSLDSKNEYFMETFKLKRIWNIKAPFYFEFYDIISSYLKLVLFFFGIIFGIIIFSAFINQYNIMKHSVNSRKHYLTMLRAIGAKDSTIPRLYLMESYIIVKKASIIFASFSFVLATAIKIVIDIYLKKNGITEKLHVNLSPQWGVIIWTILITVLFIFAISLSIAFVCSYFTSKKRMTDILNNE